MSEDRLDDAAWIRDALARYERPLIQYAARITGDLEQARDVVQDTFLRLCKTDRAKVDGHVAAWLYTVCRNRALDVRKKEARMQPLPQGTAENYRSSAPPPRAVAEHHETHELVLEAMAALPEKQQEAFRLKFQSGMSYKEISAITGTTLSNVRYLLHNALKTVRERLRGQLDLARQA